MSDLPPDAGQVNEIAKSQTVRVLDVVLIGPLMCWGGLRLRNEHPVAGGLLAALGVLTVWYNGRNYLRVADAARPPSSFPL